MTKQEMSSEAANQDARIKELTDENELLFEQLHVVQEELEKYYHKLKECEQSKGTAVASSSLPLDSFEPRLPEALAENQKLRALVAQQKIALRVETQNSLPSRLGDMLIKGVSSTGAFLALPGNLRKMWKALERTTPPAELGGKSFQKIIDVYGAGGADAVEKLLDSVFIAPNMRANAYTALARHLMIIDVQKAAAFARLAYEADPRPYRFKWLAFRMHDADDAVTAEAMLEMLPADIPMSESEQRQVLRIRHESTQSRKNNAEKDASVRERKNEVNHKIALLTQQIEKHQREENQLRQRHKELQELADTRQVDLMASQASIAEQKKLVERRDEEIGTLNSIRDELQALADSYRIEADTLQVRLTEQEAEQAKQAEEWRKERHSLKTAQEESQTRADNYKVEVEALQVRLAEQDELAERRGAECDALKAEQAELHTLAAGRKEEIEVLKAAQAELQSKADSYRLEANTLQMRLTVLENWADERKTEMDRLTVHIDEMNRLYQEEIKLMASQQNEIISAVSLNGSVIASGFEKQGADLERVRKSVQQSCKHEVDNALQQVVAYSGLSAYFESGKLPEVAPWKRVWPASPDFILWLVELIDRNDYDLILEFGSGITTLYTAKTLAAREKNSVTAKSVSAVAFEHLEQFFLQTRDILSQAGLGECVNVIHAPLQEYTAPDGTAYQYYSCQKTLGDLSLRYKSANSRILVIVDGPPGATNKNARYPAFPLVMKYFASAHIDFLLDDYIRNDEKELAGMWQNACATAGIEHAIVEKQLERGALLLQIAPLHAEMK